MCEQNKREYERFRTLTSAYVSFAGKKTEQKAMIIDISMGGLALVSTAKYEKGDKIIITLFGNTIKLNGIVRRMQRSYGNYVYGIKLHHTADNDMINIANLIETIFDRMVNARATSYA